MPGRAPYDGSRRAKDAPAEGSDGAVAADTSSSSLSSPPGGARFVVVTECWGVADGCVSGVDATDAAVASSSSSTAPTESDACEEVSTACPSPVRVGLRGEEEGGRAWR